MSNQPIGIFDSGVGGLNVLSACLKIMPNENYIYLFDKSCSPYGSKTNRYITSRVQFLTQTLVEMNCKSVVIACNTATNVAIDRVRGFYDLPIVGVEPPVLPAVRNAKGGKILVLLTEATSKQKKFYNLLKKCDYDNIIVAPQPNLARLTEQNFCSLNNLREHIYTILEGYEDVESVVLGCTHYYFVRNIISDFYGGKIDVYDASAAVASRLKFVLTERDLLTNSEKSGNIKQFYL